MPLSPSEAKRLLAQSRFRYEMVEALSQSLPWSPPTISGLHRKLNFLTDLARSERGWWNLKDRLEAEHLCGLMARLNRSALARQRDVLRNSP